MTTTITFDTLTFSKHCPVSSEKLQLFNVEIKTRREEDINWINPDSKLHPAFEIHTDSYINPDYDGCFDTSIDERYSYINGTLVINDYYASLLWFCKHDCLNVLEIIMLYGTDTDLAPLLNTAISNSFFEIVKLLVSNGAKITEPIISDSKTQEIKEYLQA